MPKEAVIKEANVVYRFARVLSEPGVSIDGFEWVPYWVENTFRGNNGYWRNFDITQSLAVFLVVAGVNVISFFGLRCKMELRVFGSVQHRPCVLPAGCSICFPLLE